jgi:hypothetical protein
MWRQLKKLSQCTVTLCSSRHDLQGEAIEQAQDAKRWWAAHHISGAPPTTGIPLDEEM